MFRAYNQLLPRDHKQYDKFLSLAVPTNYYKRNCNRNYVFILPLLFETTLSATDAKATPESMGNTRPLDVTWLDERMKIALQHENAKYDAQKEQLKNEIEKLRATVS